MKHSPRILALFVLSLVVYCLAHVSSQQPRLSLNAEQFGLILLKGGYRSWFLSFSDGKTWDSNGVLRSIVITGFDIKDSPSQSIFSDTGWSATYRGTKYSTRFGYRLWPKLSHTDMREMRTQLQYFRTWAEELNRLVGFKAMPEAWQKLDHALSSDAGLHYHHRDEYKRLADALEKISGFGRSAHGTPDMTFDELSGFVNETVSEALTDARSKGLIE